jgi:hypothetical protein
MAGFGTGPHGLAPLGFPTDEPEQLAPAKIGSAKKIDAKTRRYVVADDGGFEAMDGTAQRVLLLVCMALGKETPFITPQGNDDPDIELDLVDITSDRDTSNRLVRYKNLRTNTYQYVDVR